MSEKDSSGSASAAPKKASKGAWWKSSSLTEEKKNETKPKKEVQKKTANKVDSQPAAPAKSQNESRQTGKPIQKKQSARNSAEKPPIKKTEQVAEGTGQANSSYKKGGGRKRSQYNRKARGRKRPYSQRYNRKRPVRKIVLRDPAEALDIFVARGEVAAQVLRKPSVRRMLRRPRPVVRNNPAQERVMPAAVRSGFTGETSYLQLICPDKKKEVVKDAAKPVRKVEKIVKPIAEEKEPEEKVVTKLLINAEEPEECRLALLENGRLQSLHVSTVNSTQTKNNIYKAKIVAVEPNLQAAFVDYGRDKNGFLPFSEIHPEYYKQNLDGKISAFVKERQWKKLSITDVVEKGQEVLVQVVKEEIGKKGANMTTYLSLPGRCVVLMPGSDSTGISRKISGEGKRNELREIMKNSGIPEGIGWIVRTASIDITENALNRDVEYLLRLWEDTRNKAQKIENVGMVYEDHHSILRFLREHFDPSIEEILVDDREAMEQVKEFIDLLPSNQRDVRVRLHRGNRPIFNQCSVEDQIESIYQPQVNLPSGGSIVINPTEALVAIDVNSGSTSKSKNFEASIFQANIEAAQELARQLRLRDLGGLIVVDFIDMRSNKNIREVEKTVRKAMKRDKAKVDFTRISKFGLMEISRQKLGAPIEAGNYRVCEHCKGRGTVKSVEALSLFYLRRIQTGASRKNVAQVECHFPLDVALYLHNKKRNEINEIEKKYATEIFIHAEPEYKPAQNEIIFNKLEKEVK